jgi:hypothetical protein
MAGRLRRRVDVRVELGVERGYGVRIGSAIVRIVDQSRDAGIDRADRGQHVADVIVDRTTVRGETEMGGAAIIDQII